MAALSQSTEVHRRAGMHMPLRSWSKRLEATHGSACKCLERAPGPPTLQRISHGGACKCLERAPGPPTLQRQSHRSACTPSGQDLELCQAKALKDVKVMLGRDWVELPRSQAATLGHTCWRSVPPPLHSSPPASP
eukprot:359900-Chlamydomonas_euryale.AAC.11